MVVFAFMNATMVLTRLFDFLFFFIFLCCFCYEGIYVSIYVYYSHQLNEELFLFDVIYLCFICAIKRSVKR